MNTISCAVIGYGGAFMGRAHASYIEATEGLALHSICDISPERTEAAKTDFAGVQTFNSVEQLLASPDLDLCVIVLPHNLHASVAVQCSQAGKHVITEKPMCVTVEEATRMIDAARASDKMLSVFHNRRQDGDYQTLRRLLVEEKLIGEVFAIEMFAGGFAPQDPKWWRSSKAISGGYFYDWGAHFLDWALGILPGKIVDVSGYFHKRVWHDVTNEDQVQAVVRFDSGAVLDITMSSIAHASKPRWWVLGERGAVVERQVDGRGCFEVTGDFAVEKHRAVLNVPFFGESHWQDFYANIAAHLREGAELGVKPEQARRLIAIMEGAEKSSQLGHSVSLPTEAEDSKPQFARSN